MRLSFFNPISGCILFLMHAVYATPSPDSALMSVETVRYADTMNVIVAQHQLSTFYAHHQTTTVSHSDCRDNYRGSLLSRLVGDKTRQWHQTHWDYDALGRTTHTCWSQKGTNSACETKQYTLSNNGLSVKTSNDADSEGYWQVIHYDPLGRETSRSKANSMVSGIVYTDINHEIKQKIDAYGNVTHYYYDAQGQQIDAQRKMSNNVTLDNITRYDAVANSKSTQLCNQLGQCSALNTLIHSNDTSKSLRQHIVGFGDATLINDNFGEKQQAVRKNAARLTQQTSYQHNALGQLIHSQLSVVNNRFQAVDVALTHDLFGALTSKTVQRGSDKRTPYGILSDAQGHMVTRWLNDKYDKTKHQVERRSYASDGSLYQLTDWYGNRFTYTPYYWHGKEKSKPANVYVQPADGKEAYDIINQYDAQHGWLVKTYKTSDPNSKIDYTYYQRGKNYGRVKMLSYADGKSIQYNDYDAKGRVTSMTDVDGVTTHYRYDSSSEALTDIQQQIPNNPAIVNIHYVYQAQDLGKVSRIERQLVVNHQATHAQTTIFHYNPQSQITQLDTSYGNGDVNQLHYTYVGKNITATSFNYRNLNLGISHSYTMYYQRNEVTGRLINVYRKNADKSQVKEKAQYYRYDVIGNLRSDRLGNGASPLYTYDGYDRLQSMGDNERFSYQRGQNFTDRNEDAGTTKSYQFDAQGHFIDYRLHSKAANYHTQFSYYANDARRESQFADGHRSAFYYTQQGQQLLNVHDSRGGHIDYLLNGKQHIAAIRTTNNPAGDNRVQISFYNHDLHSSRVGERSWLVSSTGEVSHPTSSYRQYDAYGKEIEQVSNNHWSTVYDGFGYSDEWVDNTAAGGMQNLRARFYDARTKRFLSRDSLPLLTGFAYGDGQPLMKVDRNGHKSEGITTLLLFGIGFISITLGIVVRVAFTPMAIRLGTGFLAETCRATLVFSTYTLFVYGSFFMIASALASVDGIRPSTDKLSPLPTKKNATLPCSVEESIKQQPTSRRKTKLQQVPGSFVNQVYPVNLLE